jgi:hypothetical protein
VIDAAGGIYSNISDMCKWVMMQLNHGKYGDGLQNQLFSDKVQWEMWCPHTIIPVGDPSDYNTHFRSYGLGWGLSDVRGYKQVMHTGGLAGMVTQVTLIPELKLGIMVFTNQQSGAAFRSVTNTILDSYFGIKGIDRIRQYSLAEQKAISNAEKITADIWKEINAQNSESSTNPDYGIYTGKFSDVWFGEVTISERNGKLFFASKRSPALAGEMFPYKGNTFLVKWDDRSLDADAFVMFNLDKTGKAKEMTMEAISPLTDFSFDFQDLDFKRLEK